MANISSEEMLSGYIPSPRIYLTESTISSPRKRHPRFDYYDLCVSDHTSNSAWIRYNEQRIEQLQKRIDLMLQIDDNEEAHYLLASPYTIQSRIDDLLNRKPKRRTQIINYHDRIRMLNLTLNNQIIFLFYFSFTSSI
jgi:hypothetical protein